MCYNLSLTYELNMLFIKKPTWNDIIIYAEVFPLGLTFIKKPKTLNVKTMTLRLKIICVEQLKYISQIGVALIISPLKKLTNNYDIF